MRILKSLCSVSTITANNFKNYLKGTKNYERNLQNLKIISLQEGKCVAELEIQEQHTNILGTLHGGMTATLADVVSSYGLSSLEKGCVPHVSVNLNIRYLKGVKLGKKIIIESETVKCGKNLAFLEIVMKDKDSGDILAKGEHTKYLLS